MTELTVHEAVPSPWAQPAVNSGFWLDGCAVSATDTSVADPFRVETVTTKAAVCPRLMLDCERWTLTHSSGCEVGLVLVLALGLGLVVMEASRVAAVVLALAELEAWDGDGEADPDWEGEPDGEEVCDGEEVADGEGVADSDGEVVGEGEPELDPFGLVLGLVVDTEVVEGSLLGESLAVGELSGDGEGEGVSDGDGDGDGVGEGEVVAEAGRSWHLVSVVVVAPGVAAEAAWAAPATPRVRKPPLSKVTAATRTYAKRIKIACLRCSSGLPCALR